ncbi:hypothetical protein SBRCBS47491_005031 [Sporothrix bragantina]|uniref:Proteasome inhibitor PI31 subunit n=1 Tax=Sporothrix bragantina TaxID=671064 RepID=A0ABP0BU50_9PEZI
MATTSTDPAGASNPVGPAQLLAAMNAVLPTGTLLDDDGNALPDIDSPLDAVSLFCHAFLTSLGFRFQQVVHNNHSGTTRTYRNDEASDSSNANRLPQSWNDGSDEADLGFTYSLEDDAGGPVKSLNVSIKAADGAVQVSAVAIDSPALIGQTSISVARFLHAETLPVSLPPTGRSGSDSEDTSSSRRIDTLGRLFRDADTLSLLSQAFQFDIVQRLVPSLTHPGYTRVDQHPDRQGKGRGQDTGVSSLQEGPSSKATAGDAAGASAGASGGANVDLRADTARSETQVTAPPFMEQPESVRPPHETMPDPGPFVPDAGDVPRASGASRTDPTRPVPDFLPPQFEDEHQMLRAPGAAAGRGIGSGGAFGGIGADDLNPPNLGPNDPLRPSLAGSGDNGLRIGPGGFGGMHPTFDDPLFTGIRGQGGRGGNGEFDPQHPPGARWDEPGPAGADPSGLFGDFGEDGLPPGQLGRGRGGGRGGGFGPGGFGGGLGGGFGGSGGGFGSGSGGFGGFGGGGFA